MLDARWYVMAPWSVACPVTESRFVAQLPEHAVYNVQTDLAAIGAFGGMVERPDLDALMYSDLQTQTGLHEYGRLGSGRTGYYRGAYLKGIGRTPLAANWWRFKDRFHATGHLPASCAIRELVVSRYFLAKGKGHIINPCRGLLVAELEPQLREARSWRRWKDEECLPCDLALQAISVKDHRFLRFSNVLWHLGHINVAHAESDLIRFFGYLMNGLCPYDEVDVGALMPRTIARTIAATVDRTIENFREYFRLGISWLMPYNNFTIDGRFCDLDVPLFTGSRYLGAALNSELWQPGSPTAHAPDHVDFASIFGLNVIAYLHQVRVVLCAMEGGFRGLLRASFHYSSAERDFMSGFLAALEESLPSEHPLWSGAACAKMIKRWIDEDCEISAADRPAIDEIVDHAVVMRLEHAVAVGRDIAVEKVDMRCARAGASPNLTESFYAIRGSRVRPEQLEEAQLLNDQIARLDALTGRDELLAALGDARDAIERQCGTTPASAS